MAGMIWRGAAIAMLAVLAAPAAAQPSLAGAYDGSQAELAAALRLGADGRFQYALSYGALDEAARGRWERRDGHVALTTDPAPVPPRFVVERDDPAPAGLFVSLADPDLLQGSSLTLMLFYDDAAEPVFVEADEDGRVPLAPGRRAVAVVPDLPVYPIPVAPYRLGPGGHRIVFRFEPNDIGVAAFDGERLEIDGDALILRRHDRLIRFRR